MRTPMSIRDAESPPRTHPPSFADALNAGPGEKRRRILQDIMRHEKERAAQLQAATRATLYPRPPTRSVVRAGELR